MFQGSVSREVTGIFLHVTGYIKTGSYSISAMEDRERDIREKAEQTISTNLSFHKRWFFNWILFHARRGVRHREHMRFSRTKLFGVFRDLFRAIGTNLVLLGLLENRQVIDLFRVEVTLYTGGGTPP